jgi:D-inositol-3-phosphate glycosyltransferase
MLAVHTCPLAAPGGKETGGMNVYVRELMRQLGRRGYLVDCFTRSQSSAIPHIPDTDLGPNVRVIHVTAGAESPLPKADAWNAAPEFVAGVRAFMASQDIRYDLYHSHYWISGWVAGELARRRPAPIVHMFHTLGAMKDLSAGEGAAPEIAPRRGIEAEIMRFADAIVAATPIDRQHMVDLYGADPARIAIIPPGVDLDLFRPIPPAEALAFLGEHPAHRMILFVGRPDPVKGLDMLVHAIAKIITAEPELAENSCLCIVGGDKTDDPAQMTAEMAHIDRLRRQFGIEDFVTFLGPQTQDILPYYYSAAQVVVVPSRYESFGMVALEAMACGAPVIATRVGGLTTLVRHGRTGFLVPEGDPDAMAAALRPLLDNPDLRRELGMQGVATAEGYSWASITERIERLYERVWGAWAAAAES